MAPGRVARECTQAASATTTAATGPSAGSQGLAPLSLRHPIRAEDVGGLCPVVKACLPPSPLPEALELLTKARALQHADAGGAFELVQEALLLLYQVVGTGHRDVAYCCQTAAQVLAAAGENLAAIQQQQRAVLLYERILGPDHNETAYAHNLLATYLSAADVGNAAIRHMARHAYLVQLGASPSHPDVTAAYARLAVIYQAHLHVPLAIQCWYTAMRNVHDSYQQVQYMHALAVCMAAMGNLKEALTWQVRVWDYYKQRLGPDHYMAAEAGVLVAQLTRKAVDVERSSRALRDALAASAGGAGAGVGAAVAGALAAASTAGPASGGSRGPSTASSSSSSASASGGGDPILAAAALGAIASAAAELGVDSTALATQMATGHLQPATAAALVASLGSLTMGGAAAPAPVSSTGSGRGAGRASAAAVAVEELDGDDLLLAGAASDSDHAASGGAGGKGGKGGSGEGKKGGAKGKGGKKGR